MTVDQPEFDPELIKYSCYIFDSVCYALRTAYSENDEYPVTECGIRMPDSPLHSADVQFGPRGEFVEAGDVQMCPECWPSDLVD